MIMMFLQQCFFAALMSLILPVVANAQQPTSFKQPHPMNWLHSTPVGETPGWSGQRWYFFELGTSNVWNAPLKMKNTKTNAMYTYEADYEQTTAVLEVGSALTKKIAMSLELPFAHRAGGFLDRPIEEFHDLLGTRNFSREQYDVHRTRFATSTDGVDGYSDKDLTGISNVKPKIKWWAKKCKTEKSPTCGFAISTQLKIPVQSSRYGGTTGKLENSVLIHLGFPVFTPRLQFWGSVGYSKLRRDDKMPGWPLIQDHEMYEINFDFAINDRWGLLFSARTESPYLDRKKLEYVDPETRARARSNNRAASGWNSLVRWQGAQALGVRHRKKNRQINFQIIEDWGIGSYDSADNIYSNGAPDFTFAIQSSWTY
jgi:hypothetical protein